MAGGVAGPRQAKSGIGVSAPLRVLPDTHDRELPGAELHHRPRWSAVRVAARVPAEQPDHGAQSWLFWLWNSGKRSEWSTTVCSNRKHADCLYVLWIIYKFPSGVFRFCGFSPTTSHGLREGLLVS